MIQHQDLNLIHESTLLADAQHFSSPGLWVTGTASIAVIAALAYAAKRHALLKQGDSEAPKQFTNENITASFVAAIPSITRELNLEVATATQTETFTQTSRRTLLWGWLDLGSSVVQVRVPVTYRYHIPLREPWELRVREQTVIVRAPLLRPSLPPAIHIDQIERLTVRGWCRGSPRALLQRLERQITPMLSEYAANPKQLNQVREASRLSVAEFVRLWLEREGQWQPGGFTAIQVQFADEAALPPDADRILLR